MSTLPAAPTSDAVYFLEVLRDMLQDDKFIHLQDVVDHADDGRPDFDAGVVEQLQALGIFSVVRHEDSHSDVIVLHV